MDFGTPLSALTGIGSIIAQRLHKLGLKTVGDLIQHYPFRYDDFSQSATITETKIGNTVTLKGELWGIKNTYTRFRKVLTQATFNDGTGTVEIVWFNQPWLIKNLRAGDKIQVSGKVTRKGSKVTLVSPVWEKLIFSNQPEITKNNTLHTGRLVPVYPETYGLQSKWIRQQIARLLPQVLAKSSDPIPAHITKGLISKSDAIDKIHFPGGWQDVRLAKDRLAFEELFYIQLSALKKKQDWVKEKKAQPLNIDRAKLEKVIKHLPFELTAAQKKVVEEIIADLKKDRPMNRLLQGDVGSGKTVVAAIISYLNYLNNQRAILMAPTEILAFQHYQTFVDLLAPYGISVGIYTGSRKFTKSNESNPDIIIGTHALLSKKLELDSIGLVIIDEQQRFGVEQRGMLRNRASAPHFLTMTATPIPRTVMLTLYGDLDLSIIDKLPRGRKLVKTHFVPSSKRADAYKFMEERVRVGQQIYIITPLIEKSETLVSAKAAKVEHERLKKDIFPNLRLGLLHGRLKSKEKESAVNAFKNHEIDILVSTSVVEVGVDVPNATIMVIEGAERFGLAQLHQLRGRVGRGELQSYALLFTEEEVPAAVNRLKHLETIHDGLKLAELDLKIRGGGELFGLRQSGQWELKIASFSDLPLIEKTREAARKILAESPALDKYPKLAAKLVGLDDVMPD